MAKTKKQTETKVSEVRTKSEQAKEKAPTDADRVKELTETLQRMQAEFENYKKRTEKETIDFRQYAETELIKSFLPVLDNFELALNNQTSPEEFSKGVELIFSQFFQILEDKGLKSLDCKGEKFNPYKHEALLTEESNKEENTVLEELQKGYTLHEKVIRHAKVKVAKKATKGGK